MPSLGSGSVDGGTGVYSAQFAGRQSLPAHCFDLLLDDIQQRPGVLLAKHITGFA